jgi:hypothetical protein
MTAILAREPGSRATDLISMMPSLQSVWFFSLPAWLLA